MDCVEPISIEKPLAAREPEELPPLWTALRAPLHRGLVLGAAFFLIAGLLILTLCLVEGGGPKKFFRELVFVAPIGLATGVFAVPIFAVESLAERWPRSWRR
ncbi:hypothetical protein HY251_04010, partial [bacterium]|nr:hypothetical protein [bacterium]